MGHEKARIRVPNLADGLWPAFWTLGNNFSEAGTARFEVSDDATGTFSYDPSMFSINERGHTALRELPATRQLGIPIADGRFSRQD